MRLIDQIFLTHLQTVFGSTATIEDVKVTNGTVEFTLPIDQVQQFPHGVAVEITGIYDGKLDCSMTEGELTVQLHFALALMAASAPEVRTEMIGTPVHTEGLLNNCSGWMVSFDTKMAPAPPAFCDTRLPQLIAEESVLRQAKQERENWNERNQAKKNKEV